ncbi:MAG TPA: YgjP-like metallopeptidase domain-containing protein, partial [Candidatus Saccharimonadales bacterium]|nr:YgjP-like metallopeptidase domain-containing protein [Candidatus Saccharimonadales bacterium]
MAFKQFVIGQNTEITVYKKRSARNLRLSINSTGKVRVTIPLWAPYREGLSFAKSRLAWIESNKPVAKLISENQAIGKAHHIKFIASGNDKVTTRVKQTEIIINYPMSLSISSPEVQNKAKSAAVRALKSQAEKLLPGRLEMLAAKHGFNY